MAILRIQRAPVGAPRAVAVGCRIGRPIWQITLNISKIVENFSVAPDVIPYDGIICKKIVTVKVISVPGYVHKAHVRIFSLEL